MNKLGIWGIALASAFVAGTLLTGFAYADDDDDDDNDNDNGFGLGKKLKKLLKFLKNLKDKVQDNMMAIMNLDERVTTLEEIDFTTNTYSISSDLITTEKIDELRVDCEPGDKVISGSASYTLPENNLFPVTFVEEPVGGDGINNPTGWKAVIDNPTNSIIGVNVVAICLDLTP